MVQRYTADEESRFGVLETLSSYEYHFPHALSIQWGAVSLMFREKPSEDRHLCECGCKNYPQMEIDAGKKEPCQSYGCEALFVFQADCRKVLQHQHLLTQGGQ